MRILINHLTRMHGGHICLAGIDLETRRHVRPVLAEGPLPFYLLARYGGPFDMATIVNLGSPRHVPTPPHVEDHVFVPRRVRAERLAAVDEFWGMLDEVARPTLQAIFGPAIRQVGSGRFGAAPGQGHVSLGVLKPATPPKLYIARNREGKPSIRIRFSDGQADVDASVTDLRLFGPDHAAPAMVRVRAVGQWLADSQQTLLCVGLTREYSSSADVEGRHWLQVNNIHLRDEPIWRLG